MKTVYTSGVNPQIGQSLTIDIDYERDNYLTTFAKDILFDRYLIPGESSPQEAFARAACAFSDNQEHAQRIYNYVSNQWFMFATPVLSNGGTKRGMPISCFLNHVDDSREGLGNHYVENIWLASSGGGIGGNWSQIRSKGTATSKGNKTTGIIPFMHVVDSQMLAFSQGATRRGSYAAYLDVNHPEIEEFISMRRPTGGDVNRKNLNLFTGINISDEFMKAVESDSNFPLKDPHTGATKKEIHARTLWIELLTQRVETGTPYLHFIDTSNRALPEKLKEKGLRINHSNLCTEIFLPTDENRTAVCCLSSVNLAKFKEWEHHELFIGDITRMLDNVLQYFIDNAPDALHRAKYSAERERSIGIGALGFHTFLQKEDIAFGCALAGKWNDRMFKNIKSRASIASIVIAMEKGEAPDMEGSGERFAHLLAVAPNASSGIIMGVSPSIEPWNANAFTQKTLTGSHLVKNIYLDKLLQEKYDYTEGSEKYIKLWREIITHQGSVQQLDFMDEEDKEVFKTAFEIDQRWIIEHASHRQKYICQGQSVNLFIKADEHLQNIHNLHKAAWSGGLKGLYYCRSGALSKAENVTEKVERVIRKDTEDTGCLSCEG